ncbi:Hydantoin racemase [Hyphomicrobiales bacterium]|nr:Hydantoin racemase [Hyphomicrobiales bacterium]CAH1697301.1 Hydantoin racemase [Hyphomicrobiales bacterium]CAI0345487.1 allantoin racemase [Hyphomicrobiales bacterium]
MTAAIEFAAAPFRAAGSNIVCVEMKDGPAGIVTESELLDAVAPMLSYALAVEADAAAFVIACFGDPGLHLLRERLKCQVFGIGECGVLAALARGQRFGVISLLQSSIPRHMRWFGAMGVHSRLAGDRAMGLGVADLKNRDAMFSRMVEVGQMLKQQDGADVILMGGAAMSFHRAALEAELEMPVIDPNFAALTWADGVSKLR